VRYLLAILAIAGIVVSALALQVHYSTESAPCRLNDKWDCGVVNHSPYAEIRGVPVAAIGIAGYLLIGILTMLRRRDWLVATILIGLAFALFLTHIEKDILGAWCLYCVISQGIIALMALLAIGWLVWANIHVAREFMGLVFLGGAFVGLLVVRGFFFDPAEELAWRVFWSGGWASMATEPIFESATFAKCLCGVLFGGVGAVFAVRHSFNKKTPRDSA